MNYLKFFFSLLITLLLVLSLGRSWEAAGTRIPPLGKFLDPFHGFWQNMEPDDFVFPEQLDIPGLKQPVTIVYDSLMIPHVFAQNDEDLYLAQGYVTAMHRLWQMEFQTHAAAGRISEILGPGKDNAFLNYDRSQRRFGMVYAAQNAETLMQRRPEARLVVNSYSTGINEYINGLHYKNLPLEYKLMDYHPEEWTPLKCALLLKSMAQTLNMGDKDIQMTNALKLFGKETVDLLYPDREPVGDPIVDKPGGWTFDPVSIDSVPMALPDELIHISGLTIPDPDVGSNNWAVSGSKTKSGAPILCNDPHLSTTLPSIWYVIHLNAPGINSMGASLPGAPGIISGFNDSIAWGMTNAQRDLVDWYAITFENNRKEKYLLDSQWVDTRKVIEQFNVRGALPVYDTIIYTHWGPVPYDENFRSENNLKQYAFRWVAHDESEELMAFLELNRGRNHDDYMNAMNHFSSPAQNFVFASVSGDVAMRIQGKFPVRRKEEGKFVLDGSRSSSGWQAFIPNEHNVLDKNPERGFVSSANQYPVDETYPYYITATSYEAYRNRRINNVLRESFSVTVKDMMNLQYDNHSIKAEESLPTLISYLDVSSLSTAENEALSVLKDWDYQYDVDSKGAIYYEAWWSALFPLLWEEMRREGISLSYPTTWNTIQLLKTRPDLAFFDIQDTPDKETAREVVNIAFRTGIEKVEEWKIANAGKPFRWADYKDTFVPHLTRIEALGRHVEHGGNSSIVNASSRTNGPSWRMVVSLEPDGVKAFANYPGGQSGNPGSPHYASLLDYWANAKYFNLPFPHTPDEASARMYSTTTLNPKTK